MCMMETGYKVTRLMNCVQLQAFVYVLSSFWFLLPHLFSFNSVTRVLSVSNFILMVITIYRVGVVNLEYYEHKLIKFVIKFMRRDQKLCMRKTVLVNLSPILLYIGSSLEFFFFLGLCLLMPCGIKRYHHV